MDTNRYTLRDATIDDLPVLLQFEQGIVAAERPYDSTLKADEIHYYDLAEKITSPSCMLKVIETESVLVASGYAEIKDAKDYYIHDKYAHLGFMYVSAEHRGKGLNQYLVEALIQWCQTMQVDEIRLEVYPDNSGAIRAYEKVGFKPQLLQMRLNRSEK